MAEDRGGFLAAPVIARNAYQMYLARPEKEESAVSVLSGLQDYDPIKEAGLIDEGL